jgi:ubiquinone biosynthesis accessory factor UbiK
MDPRLVDDLAKRLAASVPESLQALKHDVEQNFRSILQSGLTRLDLVSRQEFDVQVAVLRRTREKLEFLEKRLAEMEREAGTQ